MYLNVNLTTPSSGAESTCTTPKTPEILNSIISLTNSSVTGSYTHPSQIQPTTLLSPASSISSPNDETASTSFTTQCSFNHPGLPTPTSPPAGHQALPIDTKVASPPELTSPVQPMEATKSALIKEGLKHQIRWKLQAAGVSPPDLLSETKELKEEHLTPEDEERRRRRRERNKVAATKCRNKKKEKTCILISESEDVEDENLKLKSEIQRLMKEKSQLEKLLRDPTHTATCRHTCVTMGPPPPPVVVVSPPDAEPSPVSSENSPVDFNQQCIASSAAYTTPVPTNPSSYSIPSTYVPVCSESSQMGVNGSFSTPVYSDIMPDSAINQSSPNSFPFATTSLPNDLPAVLTNDLYVSPEQDAELVYPPYVEEFLGVVSSGECERLENTIPISSTCDLDNPMSTKNRPVVRRARHVSESRFNPYIRPDISEFDMSPPGVHTPSDEFVSPPTCGQNIAANHYSIDISQNQYYPPCSFESM